MPVPPAVPILPPRGPDQGPAAASEGNSRLPSLPWESPHLAGKRGYLPLNGGPEARQSLQPRCFCCARGPGASRRAKSRGVSNALTHSDLLASLQSLHPRPRSQWSTPTGCRRARPATLQTAREARLEEHLSSGTLPGRDTPERQEPARRCDWHPLPGSERGGHSKQGITFSGFPKSVLSYTGKTQFEIFCPQPCFS